MNRRRFLRTASGAGLGALAAGWPAGCRPVAGRPAGGDRPPNLVVIMADDLGYGDIGCYGHERIRTPALDRLAAGGVRFTDFHSSGAVCSPTRAGLMTGRYQQRARVPGVISVGKYRNHGLAPEEVTFAECLKRRGYATAVFGKWHLGYKKKFNPTRQGFDEFVGYVSGNVDYISHVDQSGRADWWHGDALHPEEGYTTHLITQHALDFIERHKDGPFCLYIAHEAPHYPYQGPDDPADRTVGGTFHSHGSREDKATAYKIMVEEMDAGIGRVMDALDRAGLARDTFVFFCSDNGATPLGSNGPLRGHKGQMWEGGHRVPAVAYRPGRIRPGRTCGDPAITLDIFPTLLAIAGAEAPAGRTIDGTDLSPMLFDETSLPPRTLFWAMGNQRAVRDGPWKLVCGVRGLKAPVGLYHLGRDLAETNNLAQAEPDRVRALRAALEAWEKEVGAGEPMPTES
jgi:arylsulfatase A-like enzyme